MGRYNLNLPILQEKELLVSYIERIAILNDITQDTICFLLNIKSINEINIFNNIEFIKETLGITETANVLFEQHTLFKVDHLAMDKTEADEILGYLTIGKPITYLSKNKPILNRICPLCAKEDIDQYGSPIRYIHHSYTGVNVCHKHECNLIPVKLFAPYKFDESQVTTPSNSDDIRYDEFIDLFSSMPLSSLEKFDALISNLYNCDWINKVPTTAETNKYAYYFHSGSKISNLDYPERMRALYLQFIKEPSWLELLMTIYLNYPDNLEFIRNDKGYGLKLKNLPEDK